MLQISKMIMFLFEDNNVFQAAKILFRLPETKIDSLNLDHPQRL